METGGRGREVTLTNWESQNERQRSAKIEPRRDAWKFRAEEGPIGVQRKRREDE